MVSAKELFFNIGKKQIVKGIDLNLQDPGIYTLLGANGAGKSTLIKLLSGVLTPSAGVIKLAGENLSSISRKSLSTTLSYMPQSLVPPSLSVEETLLVGLNPYIKLLPSKEIRDRVKEALFEFGLETLSSRDIKSLSGGELQKVLLAKALIKKPKILFLDEPISHLDPKNQIDSLGFIKEYVKANGIFAVIVLHDINMALRFSDSIIGIKDGKVEFYKSSDEVTKGDFDSAYGIDCELLSFDNKKIVYY
ncbi:MAG: ABC transporter ATP-binding protein [Campylobacterales bacterium]